jgi:hypothetical protein
VTLLFRDRIVAKPLWNHEHLAFLQFNCLTFHLYPKAALENEKEFVFILMAMPCQRSVNLGDLHVRVINLTDDPR